MARLQRGRDKASLALPSHLSAHLKRNQWEWWRCLQGEQHVPPAGYRGSHGSWHKQGMIQFPSPGQRACTLSCASSRAENHPVSLDEEDLSQYRAEGPNSVPAEHNFQESSQLPPISVTPHLWEVQFGKMRNFQTKKQKQKEHSLGIVRPHNFFLN